MYMACKKRNVLHPQNLKSLMNNILRWVSFQGMAFRSFFDCLLIIYRGVYMVLSNFEKKLTLCEAEMGPGNELRYPSQKSADTFKFLITQVRLYQKKVNTISHVRQTEGLTIIINLSVLILDTK